MNFYDTSALLGEQYIIDNNCYVSTIVIDELENIKTSAFKDEDVKFRARKVVRELMKNLDIWHNETISRKDIDREMRKHPFLCEKNDHYLICEALILAAKGNSIHFITQDACLYLICKENFPQLNAKYISKNVVKEALWDGYKVIKPTDAEYNALYSNLTSNIFNCVVNEYVILQKYDGDVQDILRWDGIRYKQLNYKPVSSQYIDKITPLNLEQKLAFDLFQNREIPMKILRGGFGSGKTITALAHAFLLLQKGLFEKIVFVRNNIEVKDTKSIGYLPGDLRSKTINYLLPIADHLGGIDALDSVLDSGLVEPIPLGFMRGRDLHDCIIIVDEAENLTKQHVQLLIGRVAKNSELWILGDEKQTDSKVFEVNNGIRSALVGLKGNPLFGAVKLQKSERSDVAKLADILDNV